MGPERVKVNNNNNIEWVLLGAAVALAYVPGLPAEALVGRWAVIAVGIPLVSRLDPRALDGWTWLVLIWLVGLSAVSLTVSPDPLGGTLELFYILILCGAFLAAAALDDLDAVMTGIGIGLVPSALLAPWQWFNWRPVEQGSGTSAGLFYNSEVYAEFAAILFVWAVVKRKWWMVGVTGLPLALCQSRIAVGVAVLGLLYAWDGSRMVKAVGVVLLITAAGAALAVLGFDKIASAGERIIIWLAMGEAITPMGRGLGWVTVALPIQQFAHSDALQAVVEIGYGAAALAMIPVLAYWRGRGNRAERAAFFVVCIEVVVSFPLRVPATAFVAAMLAGLMVGCGSLVRVGLPDGGNESGGALRDDAAYRGVRGASRWRGRSVPV